MKNFETITHWRTGTCLLLHLLHENFQTAATSWRAIPGDHLPPWRYGPRQVGTLRPIEPTLRSLWRIRMVLGIHPSTSFSTFIRTPFSKLRRAHEPSTCIVLDGKPDTDCDKRALRELWMTPVQYWLYCSKHIVACTACHVWYDELVTSPRAAMDRIARATDIPRRPHFSPVTARVGLWVTGAEEEIVCTDADQLLLRHYQRRFDNWFIARLAAGATVAAAYPYNFRHYRWQLRRWHRLVRPPRENIWQEQRLRRLQLARSQGLAVVK